MSEADDVLQSMCHSYSSAVNASDSLTYSRLFTEDAIRMPPGGYPEYGPEQIRKGEQADYDAAMWTVTWLLNRQLSGGWLIKRQMWNRKPE
ncbi:MAG: hypothetical protein R3276_01535 [Marinobacter sp.]|nr:hypothetical protein [Marinobacter sp.]